MNEIKHLYEFVLVVSVKLGEKSEEIINKFQDLIEKNGVITNTSKWGRKKLAYPIRKESEGEYVLFEFESNAEFSKELDRICQITDGVLRSMIIKKS